MPKYWVGIRHVLEHQVLVEAATPEDARKVIWSDFPRYFQPLAARFKPPLSLVTTRDLDEWHVMDEAKSKLLLPRGGRADL